ncbi:MAG: DNA-processing protein DprA [Kofleriaceae bacterium]
MTSLPPNLQPGDPTYPAPLVGALGRRVCPLYVRGELPEGVAVAVVGSRRASAGGVALAEAISQGLARRGVAVVSGGALGIDAAAHRGALAARGQTVAVLGTGLDVVYPDRHGALFEQISQHGALLTSFAPGTPPRRSNFVARNAIISGLCQATVVVEAELRSGSLSTARWARKQGRVVCAVPGSAGAELLLGAGAHLVRTADDVLAALAGMTQSPPAVDVDDVQAQVLAAMPPSEPIDEESLAESAGLAPRVVLRALSALQVSGMVMLAPGRSYRRTWSPPVEHFARGSRGQHPS